MSTPEVRVIYSSYANKKIFSGAESNSRIYQLLKNTQPALIARIGSTEQSCLINYIEKRQGNAKSWKPSIVEEMWHASGFFSNSAEQLDRFSEEMIEHLKNVDVLGVWFNEGEKYICENVCPQADFVHLADIEPYYHTNPWSRILEGKRVLVVHPFADSIQSQFKQRELLFNDRQVLPDFELITFRSVQSITYNRPDFENWFQALSYMQDQIGHINFDIAIVGAGAYGLPLASFIKTLGKHAVHMGGATQVLFGIKGKRWENMPFFQQLFNEYWIRPSETEKPSAADTMEGGAYW